MVSWEVGRKKPKTRELRSTTGVGALGGGFWGLLFGLIFFIPILGLAIGAAAGALMGSLADAGISRQFVEDVRQKDLAGSVPAARLAPVRSRIGILGQAVHRAYSDQVLAAATISPDRQGIGSPRRATG